MTQNAVTVAGNLTGDPEMSFTANGIAVTRFAIAHNKRIRDNVTGEWRDADPSYFNVTAWRDLGESAAASLRRGDRVIVTGELRQHSWEAAETGEKRSAVEIIADDIGASLRFAEIRIRKPARSGSPVPDPWASSVPGRPGDLGGSAVDADGYAESARGQG